MILVSTIKMATAFLVFLFIGGGASSEVSTKNQKFQTLSVSKSFYYPGKTSCQQSPQQALAVLLTPLKSNGISNIGTWKEKKSTCHRVGYGPFDTKDELKSFVEDFNPSLLNIAFVEEGTRFDGLGSQQSYWQTYPFDSALITELSEQEFKPFGANLKDLSQEKDRKEVQKNLKKLGFYSGDIDGEHGPFTSKAIEEFQEDSIDEVTGVLTNDQFDFLDKKARSSSGNSGLAAGNDARSDKEKLADLETQNLELQRENSELKQKVSRLRKRKENEELARLAVLNTPIREIFEFRAILPDQTEQQMTVVFNENCLKLKTDMSFEKHLSELVTEIDCLRLEDAAYELIPGKRPTIKKLLGLRRVVLEIQNRYSKQITSINASIFDPDFDVPMCAFSLVLENQTGENFSVRMLPDTVPRRTSSEVAQMYLGPHDLDTELAVTTTFRATAEDIKEAVAAAGLTDDKNDWAYLTAQIKQFDNPNVSCRPTNAKRYSISKDGKDDDFLILQDGELRIPEISLVPATDDLLVFISTHIGAADELGGLKENNKDYPFSNKPDLQKYYLSRSLDAIKQYIEKPDPKYKNIKIFLASDNDYEEVETAALPNVKNDFEVLRSEIKIKEPLLQPMPSVAQKLLDLGHPSSAGVLIIGSFGFGSENLCNSLELTKIWKNTSPKNRKIINFVPITQLAKKRLEYPQITDIPLALTCPDKPDVTLVSPGNDFLNFSEEVSEGLLEIVNKGFEQ